jgi:hypothetical protein
VRAGSGGRGGEGERGGGGGGRGFAQGTNICVYVPLQDNGNQLSALHYASESGLENTVGKLLSLGADAALKDKVRACSYMNALYTSTACMHAYLQMRGTYVPLPL